LLPICRGSKRTTLRGYCLEFIETASLKARLSERSSD
jgi:hypothetical protein